MGLVDFECAIYGTAGINFDVEQEATNYEDVSQKDSLANNFVLGKRWCKKMNIELYTKKSEKETNGELFSTIIDHASIVDHVGDEIGFGYYDGYVTIYHFPKNVKVDFSNIFECIRKRKYSSRKKMLLAYCPDKGWFQSKRFEMVYESDNWYQVINKTTEVYKNDGVVKFDFSQTIIAVYCSREAYMHFIKNKILTRDISNLELISVASRFGLEWRERTRIEIYSDAIKQIKKVMGL